MSKLAKKFLFGISAIMAAVLLVSLYLNSQFIGRYFLYQEKQDLERVCTRLVTAAQAGELVRFIEQAEAEEDVFLIRVENTKDNNLLNQRLRDAFVQKGIGFERYWLWEQDQLTAQDEGRTLRVYSQEKLHYSVMVAYLSLEQDFIAAAKIVPATVSTIALVSRVTGIVFFGAVAVILLLVVFLVRRITGPLAQIGQTAQSIAALDFQRLELHTGDELEELAGDINDMSGKLAQAHQELAERNRQMEALLSNVSHDLKTPVSLIKAYAGGIKDGMDDGTFLDTVIRQNERIQIILDRLLDYAKAGQAPSQMAPCRLDELVEKCLSEYALQAGLRGLCFVREITQNAVLTADREAIQTILDNLVSNAVKYADGPQIMVSLKKQGDTWCFSIRNQAHFDSPVSVEHLWEPFYVADQARNKSDSGTGLGLAIVRAAAQRYGYICRGHFDGCVIEFTVLMQ